MNINKVREFFPPFLKYRSLQTFNEIDLTQANQRSQLDPKIKFLSEQLLKLDQKVCLLRYNFIFPKEKIRADFLAKNQAQEILFAWYFDKLEVNTFLKLIPSFETIQRQIKSICEAIPELRNLEKKIPKFWIVIQDLNPDLEPLLSYLQGINLEVFRLKISNKETHALVSIQKLIKTRMEIPQESKISPQTKNANVFKSLLDPQWVDSLPKITAVKKEVSFKRPQITVDEMRDFLEVEERTSNEEDEKTDPFLSLDHFMENVDSEENESSKQ